MNQFYLLVFIRFKNLRDLKIFKNFKDVAYFKAGFRPWLFILPLFLGLTGRGQSPVWQEDFSGSTLNRANWDFDLGDGCDRGICGWGNQELQYYTNRPENVRVENGNLVIEARRETMNGKPFTSARLKTLGKMHFKYGTLEARIKVPDVEKGLWPAFWTLGAIGGWPENGEIDIMEIGKKSGLDAGLGKRRVSSAVHWESGDKRADLSKEFDNPTDLNDDYHIYKAVWTPATIKLYIDNNEILSFNIADGTASDKEEFHHPHYLLLNLAVGGNYTGVLNADGVDAPLPGKMYIDYIRLYQDAGSELYLGPAVTPGKYFGIYTEDPLITEKLDYGAEGNAKLNFWNNISTIKDPPPVPFEGNTVMAVSVKAGSWFGLGVAVNPGIDISELSDGFLKFNCKTTYTGQFKVGIKSGASAEAWIIYPAGSTQYGLERDGNWHEVVIPLSDLLAANPSLDLTALSQPFMFSGDAPAVAASFYLDNIYFEGARTEPVVPVVTLTAPASGSSYAAPAVITLAADASIPEGMINKVDFYNGTSLIATVNTSPYTYSWENVGAGTYSISALATGSNGSTAISEPVTIEVGTGLKAWFSDESTLQVMLSVPTPKRVRLAVYNIVGKRLVETEVLLAKGINSTKLSLGAGLARGVYVVQVSGTNMKLTKSLLK